MKEDKEYWKARCLEAEKKCKKNLDTISLIIEQANVGTQVRIALRKELFQVKRRQLARSKARFRRRQHAS